MARISGPTGSAVKRKAAQHIIQISNPDPARCSGLIVLDLEDEGEAFGVARKLAQATGRKVNLLGER